MTSDDILAALLSQAQDDGAKQITLRALVEEASTLGAQRALARLGLDDPAAQHDILDLRQLLTSWRDVQQTARRTIVRWLTTLILSAMLLGAFVYAQTGHLPRL